MPGGRCRTHHRHTECVGHSQRDTGERALILTIRSDGTFSAGPISGRWQAANLGERTCTLTWPPPIHTGVLAADGQKLAGADQYGNQFAAGREAYAD